MVLDSLDLLIQGVHNGGLIQRWAANLELDNIHEGKLFAQAMKSSVEAYGGKLDEGVESILSMLFNVLLVGFFIAMAIFLLETVRPGVSFSFDRFWLAKYSKKVSNQDEKLKMPVEELCLRQQSDN